MKQTSPETTFAPAGGSRRDESQQIFLPGEKQRDVPAEAALAELRKTVVSRISKARESIVIYNDRGFHDQRRYTQGQWDALVGIKLEIDYMMAARVAGGNDQGQESPTNQD